MTPPSEAAIERLEHGPKEGLAFLNEAERWLGPALPGVLEWCQPIAEVFPAHRFGRELHLISGKYSATPFGIHLDSPLERVVHLNLGPRTKRFFLWPENQFVAENGSSAVSHDLEKHLPWAKVFELDPGLGFVLPEGWYHVAASPEVSNVLALTVRRRTASSIMSATVALLGVRALSGLERTIPDFDSPAPEGLVSNSTWWRTPFEHLMTETYNRWRQQTAAAGGFDSLVKSSSEIPSTHQPLDPPKKRSIMSDERNEERLAIEDLELEADPGSLVGGPRRDTRGPEPGVAQPPGGGSTGTFVLRLGDVHLDVPSDFEADSLRRLLGVLSDSGVDRRHLANELRGPRRDTWPREELRGPRRDTRPREELLGPRRDIGVEALGPRRDTGPREELLGPRRDIGAEALGPRRDIGAEALGPRRDIGAEALGPRRDIGSAD